MPGEMAPLGAFSLYVRNWQRRLVLRRQGRLSGLPKKNRQTGKPVMQSTGRRSVVDVALRGQGAFVADVPSRAKVIARLRLGDTAFRWLTQLAAVGVLVILGGVMLSLVAGSLPA